MITGHKPAGYYEAIDGDGFKTTGELRQCAHCQFSWEYKPGSGDRRGWCLKCHAFICARPECEAEQVRVRALFPDKTISCMPFTDLVERQRDHYLHDPRYDVLPSGIVVVKG